MIQKPDIMKNQGFDTKKIKKIVARKLFLDKNKAEIRVVTEKQALN